LLANVRTHTPSGTRTVVSVRVESSQAVLAVADEGPGLDPEEATRVFERFYRVDASRSRERGGSGLGLAVVDSIVSAHGGRVEVESTPGEGATFRVHLPLAARDEPEADPGPAVGAGLTRSSDQ